MRLDMTQVMAAEKSVLGAAMIEPSVVKRVVNGLSPADFVTRANRAIYLAIKKLHSEGKPVDILTINDEMGDDEELRLIGGSDYLIELGSFVPSAVNIEHHIGMVREYGQEYRIMCSLNDITGGLEPSLPKLRKLVEREEEAARAGEDGYETAEFISEYLDALCDGTTPEVFTLGLPRIDKDLGGLPRGSVSVLAARPRVGKTALALNIMAHNIYSGKKTAFFSLEMTRKQLADRLVSMTAMLDYTEVRDKRLSKLNEAKACEKLIELLSGDRLNLYDNKRAASAIGREIMRQRVDIAFIDYVQKVRPDERRAKRNEEIESVVDRMKEIAVSENCHIMLLSQFSREGDDRPELKHLKESGAIEEGGDIILFIHRTKDGYTLKNTGEIIVAKHKYGREGFVSVEFDGAHQRFTEAAKEGRYRPPYREPGEE